ncbi:MAG: acyl-ACP--UDP-N-acetylglucosamine O-acyltransferase [Rickettsiales bacterium]|jgi:UDP-N-acetylglucosamine acyltransferase|nr:acyl-ACP--UDP-N-acetylglucosamine O-acyltransferase [Rickettsiales bacterium]
MNRSIIHPTAIVEDGSVIGDNVSVGAYSIIEKGVKIGDNTVIHPHVIIRGNTTIGKDNKFFSFSVIGEVPQDLKYKNEESKLVIGDFNSIREHCTIHLGTEGGGMITEIGNNNLLMVNTHVAHDCRIGNNNVIANNATFAGHVVIEDNVHIGGLSAAHQFVRIGCGSMLGGISGLGEDLIPYGMAFAEKGRRSSMQGLNLVGLKRAGYDKDIMQDALNYYKEVFHSSKPGSLVDKGQKYRSKYKDNSVVQEIADFLGTDTNRRFCSVR